MVRRTTRAKALTDQERERWIAALKAAYAEAGEVLRKLAPSSPDFKAAMALTIALQEAGRAATGGANPFEVPGGPSLMSDMVKPTYP